MGGQEGDMGISKFYGNIRERIGNDLLLVPAVAVVVRDSRGYILIHQRHDGTWSLPAGAIEPGETPAQAVVRKTLEETRLHRHRVPLFDRWWSSAGEWG